MAILTLNSDSFDALRDVVPHFSMRECYQVSISQTLNVKKYSVLVRTKSKFTEASITSKTCSLEHLEISFSICLVHMSSFSVFIWLMAASCLQNSARNMTARNSLVSCLMEIWDHYSESMNGPFLLEFEILSLFLLPLFFLVKVRAMAVQPICCSWLWRINFPSDRHEMLMIPICCLSTGQYFDPVSVRSFHILQKLPCCRNAMNLGTYQ